MNHMMSELLMENAYLKSYMYLKFCFNFTKHWRRLGARVMFILMLKTMVEISSQDTLFQAIISPQS